MRKIALPLLLVLAGCIGEQAFDTGTVGGDAVLNLTIPGTRASEPPFDENSIVGARLVVYHSPTPSGMKKMVLNTTDFQRVNDEMNCRKIIPAGYINVYLIANEAAAGAGAALAAIGESSPESDIDDIRLGFVGWIDPSSAGITMFRAYKGLKIMPSGDHNGDGTITYADGGAFDASEFGKVERNAAKLNIKLVWDKTMNTSWNPSQSPVTFESVTLRSMPKAPWLASGKPYGLVGDDDYFDAAAYAIPSENITATTNGCEAEMSFIVPEHIVSDKARRTYMEIVCAWNGSPMTYKLALGEGLTTKTNAEMLGDGTFTSDHYLKRNTEYAVTATIRGEGESDGVNVDVHLVASPWIAVEIQGDILNRWLNVSAVETTITASSQARIYFNSNQSYISLGYYGKDSQGTEVIIHDFLQNLNDNFNYFYNSEFKTSSGYVDLVRADGATNGIYRIYLYARGLRREITVTVSD